MYQLYYYPGGANLAPHMVLEEIGAAYELVLVDTARNGQRDAGYLRLNPHGRVPTLVEGDFVLYEAAAICLHLIDRHGAAGLAPPLGSDARSLFYQWLIYLTNTVQAEMLLFFYPERWGEGDAAAGVKAHAEARIGGMLDTIERHLAAGGPYLLGRDFSAADLYLTMLARWCRNLARPAVTRPHIRQLVETVAARPAVARALAGEGIAAPLF